MRPAGLLSLLALTVSTVATSSPRPRFSIYWNLPDRCSRKMKEPDFFSFLDGYGIIRNTNGSKIYGDKIVIIYSTSFDHYARLQINETTKEVEPISGGIPQNQSFHEFFHAAAETIKQQIPDQFYDGPAILDFEEYRYLYQYNWGKRIPYRKKSDEYTALKYPNISMKAVKARSEYEFNKAARRTILGLLRLAKKLRPYAQWGYYLMPECSGHYEKTNTQCTDLYSYNEQMAVLFHESTAIFPSIYFHNQTPVAANYRATQLRLREARRFSLSTKGRAPIYAYTKFEYDAYEQPLWYYTKQDLCAAFQGAFEEGIQGLILWSPDKQPWADRCPAIKNYVQTTLGPVARNIQKKAEKCSRRLCSGRGSCLRAGDLLLDCKWSMKEKMSNMACLCDEGYFGQHCEFHKRASKKDPKKPIKKPILLDTDFTTTAVSPTSERPETLFSSTLTPDWPTSPLPPLSPKKEPSMNEILDSIGLLPPPF